MAGEEIDEEPGSVPAEGILAPQGGAVGRQQPPIAERDARRSGTVGERLEQRVVKRDE
jgi:hypothetical protein